MTNTILAMSGSCFASAVLTGIYKEGVSMLVMQRASVVGGVVIGSSAHAIYLPTLAIVFGVAAGAIAFFTIRHLQGRFELAWGAYDTSGVLSYTLFPSLIGGVMSAILLVIYHFHGIDDNVINASDPQGIFGP